MKQSLRLLSVNHNRILREGISVLLEMDSDFELLDSVATADAAVQAFSAVRPDLTLVDLDLPAQSALEAIRRIRQIDTNAWIIGLTMDELASSCVQAIACGVSTLLCKDQIGTMLIPMIRAASETVVQFPPETATRKR